MAVVIKKAVPNASQQAVVAGVLMEKTVASLPPGGEMLQDSVSYTGTPEELQKIMEAIGLVAPKEKSGEKFFTGDRVRYTNPHFTWVKSVSVGEEGHVVRVISPIKEALQYGYKYGLLEVRLDNGNVILLHNWEVEHV